MAGKHDRVPDDDAAAKLLMTGPIVIRGLGRGMKDALLPGRSSRHRAAAGGSGSQDDFAAQPERLLSEMPQLHTGLEGSTAEAYVGDSVLEGTSPDATREFEGDGHRAVFVVAEAQQLLVPLSSDTSMEDEDISLENGLHEVGGIGADQRTEVQLLETSEAEVTHAIAGDQERPTEAGDASALLFPLAPPDADETGDRHRAVTGGSMNGNSNGQPSRGPRGRIGREAIGIGVLVVLALLCAGLITAVVLKTQADAAAAARESAAYTPPPLTSPTPEPTGPSVAIIGDSTATTAVAGVDTDALWPALLESGLAGSVTTLAGEGSGYATKTSTGSTFVQQAAKVPTTADVVAIVGGTSDASVSALSLASAATDAIAAVKERAPDAKVLLVGPLIDGGVPTADLEVIRNGLKASAGIGDATWIDLISGKWLPEKARTADAPDSLTAANEKTIASKLQQSIERALR